MDPESRRPLGVYIHVPFCRVHCPYCDFYTYPADRGRQDEFVSTLLAEIRLIGSRLNPDSYRTETIYFGGGTPALLSAAAICVIIDELRAGLHVDPAPEITLEANPREVKPDYLSALAAAGVNRLSVGVQSFSDALLRYLGRDHSAEEAVRALECVSDWENWSADLIFGSAGHDERLLRSDLDRLLAYRPPHVSLYQLTVEPRTRFGSLANRGELLVASEDVQADQYELIGGRLADAGYDHYEISNFALPNFRARHNAAYWQRKDYIGLGPSASSLLAGRRTRNVQSLPGYLRRLRHNHSAVAQVEILTPQEIRNERIWLGLRTSDGIDGGWLDEPARAWVPEGVRCGLLLNRHNGTIQLTRRGRALADTVSARLLLTDPV